MSIEGVKAKKKWCEDYFVYHPDSREIEIVGDGIEPNLKFPAVFDFAYLSDTSDSGNVRQQKRAPHLTFFSDYRDLLKARETHVIINGREFLVYMVKADLTEESFQCEAWLQ